MPQITIRKQKNGKYVASFREAAGRVRTAANPYATDWVKADQLRALAEYGIQLQKEQVAAGITSDGGSAPPLKSPRVDRVVLSRKGGAVTVQLGYPNAKVRAGLQPVRDLRGLGKGGHMLDAIRVTYIDDRKCVISITDTVSRNKARGNEKKSPWWGWTADSTQKLTDKAAELFGTGAAEYLITMGLLAAEDVASNRLVRRVS